MTGTAASLPVAAKTRKLACRVSSLVNAVLTLHGMLALLLEVSSFFVRAL